MNRFLLIMGLLSLPIAHLMYKGDKFDKIINDGACTKYEYSYANWYLVWRLEEWNTDEVYHDNRSTILYSRERGRWPWFRPAWADWNYPIYITDDHTYRYWPYRPRPIYHTYYYLRYTYMEWYFTYYDYVEVWTYVYKFVYRHRAWRQRPVFATVHYDDMPVCPACKDIATCPFSNLTDHCPQVKIKTMLDSIYSILFAGFMCAAGVLSYILWQRHEKYLYWFWETNENESEKCIRPEFLVEHNKSVLKGVKKVVGFCAKFLTRLVLIGLVLVSYIFIFIPCIVALKYAMLKATVDFEEDLGKLKRLYSILAILGMTNALTIIFLEKFGELISYKFVDFKNYRAEDDYEKALVVKFFGFSFMFNFSLIMFFAFIKGQAYTYPNDYARWVIPLGIGMMNCGPLTCIDELFVIFLSTIISKLLFINFFKLFKSKRTDYNQGKYANRHVPCWEREYVLKKFTDTAITRKFNDIFIYQAYAMLFVYICPPTALLIYLWNVWDIRGFAKDILLHRQRPTMLKTWSLGKWKMVFFALPYMAAITNALTIALQSHLIDYSFFSSFMKDGRYFVDYAMAFFNTTDYLLNHTATTLLEKLTDAPSHYYYLTINQPWYTGWKPDFCLFPGKWTREVESYAEERVYDQSYGPSPVKWWINWYQLAFFLCFVITSVVVGLVLHVCISESLSEVEETMALEDIVTRYREPGAGGDAPVSARGRNIRKKNV